MKLTRAFESITAIVVIEGWLPSSGVFHELDTTLSRAARDRETIIIANGTGAEIAKQLRALVETVPNITVQFVAQKVDRDTAVLVGIERALGDWVVVLTPDAAEIASLEDLLQQTDEYEVIFAGSRGAAHLPYFYCQLARLYVAVFSWISGLLIEWPAPKVRIYSRAAARYLASAIDGEFAIRALNFSGAFPGVHLKLGSEGTAVDEPRGFSRTMRKAFRGLTNGSAVPLRAVIGTAVLAGMVAVVSSVYAIFSYVLRDNIAPGWTTLSLQISLMTFLVAVMFALLAEYVLNVYRSLPLRRRIVIVREVRSPRGYSEERLNVIGADGAFQLGAASDETLNQTLGPPGTQ